MVTCCHSKRSSLSASEAFRQDVVSRLMAILYFQPLSLSTRFAVDNARWKDVAPAMAAALKGCKPSRGHSIIEERAHQYLLAEWLEKVQRFSCLRHLHSFIIRSRLHCRRGRSRRDFLWCGWCRDDFIQEPGKETLYSIVGGCPEKFLLVGPRIWSDGRS